MEEFALAIRRNLKLEVSGNVDIWPKLNAARAPVDCMIGEKMRQQNFQRD